VLELEQRTVREVLVPRRDVFVIAAGTTVGDAARQMASAGRSRVPICPGTEFDGVLGIAMLGTLVAADDQAAPVETLVQEPIVVPEGARVQDVIALLQRQRRQLALVADEYGSFEGIVTMEDLLEEIVGELYDELDRNLEPTDPRGATRLPDGSFELPGTFPVHDLVELGLPDAEPGDAATVAGLLLEALGELPRPGQSTRSGGVEIEALAVTRTTIERVRVRRA